MAEEAQQHEPAEHSGRAVEITNEDDFHRFLIDVLYRVGQFADFGPHDAQRPAILEDINRLREYLDGLPTRRERLELSQEEEVEA